MKAKRLIALALAAVFMLSAAATPVFAAAALPQENAGNGVMQENSSNDYLSGGDKGNPDTGAQDLSAVMAALAVVSLAGGLTLLKGKNK